MVQELIEIFDTKFSIKESVDKSKKSFKVEALILPWGKISRNGVKYNRQSFVTPEALKSWEGIPIMYNHLVEGDALPYGHVECVWDTDEGLMSTLDIDPTEEKMLHKMERGDLRHFSIHVLPSRTELREDCTEAYFGSVVETSIVPSPGFRETRFRVLAEALKSGKLDLLEEFIKEKAGDNLDANKENQSVQSDLAEGLAKSNAKVDLLESKLSSHAKGVIETIKVVEALDEANKKLESENSELKDKTTDLEAKLSELADIQMQTLSKLTDVESSLNKLLAKETSEADEDESPADEPSTSENPNQTDADTQAKDDEELKNWSEKFYERLDKKGALREFASNRGVVEEELTFKKI